jgi:hypothetical protein
MQEGRTGGRKKGMGERKELRKEGMNLKSLFVVHATELKFVPAQI